MNEIHSTPYVGPRPFERDDEARFFGRDREASDLLSLVVAHSAVLLYAQSGAGKTSLMQARLVPLLEQRGARSFGSARVGGNLPDGIAAKEVENIFIFNALLSLSDDTIDPRSLTTLSFADFLATHVPPQPVGTMGVTRVLIFDQFEELFTSHPDRWSDRAGFFESLADAIERDRRLRVLFAMREEYIASMDNFASIMPERLRTRFRLEGLRREAALQAVIRPLQGTGRTFVAATAEKMVDNLLRVPIRSATGTIDISGEFVEPVQLQVVCQQLWQSLGDDDTEIDQGHIASFGDVDQALAAYYEECVHRIVAITGISEGKLRRWFGATLITHDGTRGTVYRDAIGVGGMPAQVAELAQNLHLIRVEMRGGAPWFELTHDRFITPILHSNRAWRREHDRGAVTSDQLESMAQAWDTAGRSETGLLADTELAEAERWLAGPAVEELGASGELKAFIAASRGAADRARIAEQDRRGKRMRRIVALLIFLLVGTIVSTVVAVESTNLANQNKRLLEDNLSHVKALADSKALLLNELNTANKSMSAKNAKLKEASDSLTLERLRADSAAANERRIRIEQEKLFKEFKKQSENYDSLLNERANKLEAARQTFKNAIVAQQNNSLDLAVEYFTNLTDIYLGEPLFATNDAADAMARNGAIELSRKNEEQAQSYYERANQLLDTAANAELTARVAIKTSLADLHVARDSRIRKDTTIIRRKERLTNLSRADSLYHEALDLVLASSYRNVVEVADLYIKTDRTMRVRARAQIDKPYYDSTYRNKIVATYEATIDTLTHNSSGLASVDNVVEALERIADGLEHEGDLTQAWDARWRTADYLADNIIDDPSTTAYSYKWLLSNYVRDRDEESAYVLLQRTLTKVESAREQMDRYGTIIDVYYALDDVYSKTERYSDRITLANHWLDKVAANSNASSSDFARPYMLLLGAYIGGHRGDLVDSIYPHILSMLDRPDEASWAKVNSYTEIARMYWLAGQKDHARELHERALRLIDDPDNPFWSQFESKAAALQLLARLLYMGDDRAADSAAGYFVARIGSLETGKKDAVTLLASFGFISGIMGRGDRLQQIADSLEDSIYIAAQGSEYARILRMYDKFMRCDYEAIDSIYARARQDSSDSRWLPHLFTPNLIATLVDRGRAAEGNNLLDSLEDSTAAGPELDVVMITRIYLGTGRPEGAEAFCLNALSTRSDSSNIYTALALIALDSGNWDAAEPWLRKAADVVMGDADIDPISRNLTRANLANAHRVLRRYEAADSLYTSILADMHGIPDHPVASLIRVAAARCLLELGRGMEAEAMMSDAVERLQRVVGEKHPFTAYAMNELAKFYTRTQKPGYIKATNYFTLALNIRREIWGENHPDVAETLMDYANALRTTSLEPDAVRIGYENSARAIYAEVARRNHLSRPAGPMTVIGIPLVSVPFIK